MNIKRLVLTLIAILSCFGSASAQPTSLYLTDAPVWLHYFCDGSESDPNGSVSVQGVHCYQNLTIPNGATLTVAASSSKSGSPQNVPVGSFFAFVSGTCTIAGTIMSSGANSLDGNGGGSGGGGGGAASGNSSSNGFDAVLFGSFSSVRSAGGGSAGGPGAAGGTGVTPSAATQRFVMGYALALGAFGGSAGGVGGGNPTTSAGLGGGGIALICGAINFAGAVIANGTSGAAGSGGSGGGGGGGGGVVIMVSPNYIANSGTISVSGGLGGLGGTGAGNGGNGGNGWFKQSILQ